MSSTNNNKITDGKTKNPEDLRELIKIISIERGLSPEEVIDALEVAIASAYRKEFGNREKIYQAEFDPETLKYEIFEIQQVVEQVTNPAQQLSLLEARLSNPKAQIGDIIKTPIDREREIEFGRIASQIAKQVMLQTIKGVIHTKLLQGFKDKIGEVVTVIVDYYHKGGYMVKLGQASGYISKEHLLPTDRFKPGTAIKALIVNIIKDIRGNSRVILSRTSNDFIKALIKSEIPEVEAEIVRIDKVARIPGVRTKILVSSQEEDIDPVGSILGKKNMRIINILRQISTSMQEKIDVIENRPDDLPTMIMDALEPAVIDRVEVEPGGKKAKVYCSKDQAALAVGKQGVNIRLASELLSDIELSLVIAEDNKESQPAILVD